MPFKLFSSSKKNKKGRSASVDVIETSEQTSDEPPDCQAKASDCQTKSSDCQAKANRKTRFHLFSSSTKSSNRVHFKDTDKKSKDGESLGRYKMTKSLTHIPSNAKEDTAASGKQRPCVSGNPGRARSASYGNFMDSMTRERRLMDIVQLDNYIEYLRRTEDEGNLTNRLCCAQVLKLGLIRVEMTHRNSHERLDASHRVASLNNVRQTTQKHPKDTKDKQADSGDTDSNHSDKKSDDSVSDNPVFSNGSECDSGLSEHDTGSEPDQEDAYQTQERCSRSTFKPKKSIPVWPRDIEIF